MPLVLKGILTAEDARLAVEHGAAAVWVSNHGGRQLDRSPAGIDVLEEVVEAVAGRAEVYLDDARGDEETLDRAGREFANAIGLLIAKIFEALLMFLMARGLQQQAQ